MNVDAAASLEVGDRIARHRPHPGHPLEYFGTVTGAIGSLLAIRWDGRHDFPTNYDRSNPKKVAPFHLVYQPHKNHKEPEPS